MSVGRDVVEGAAEAARSVSDLVDEVLGKSTVDARQLERLAMARRLIDACTDESALDADLLASGLHLSRSTV